VFFVTRPLVCFHCFNVAAPFDCSLFFGFQVFMPKFVEIDCSFCSRAIPWSYCLGVGALHRVCDARLLINSASVGLEVEDGALPRCAGSSANSRCYLNDSIAARPLDLGLAVLVGQISSGYIRNFSRMQSRFTHLGV
jgi:hypothetical protein